MTTGRRRSAERVARLRTVGVGAVLLVAALGVGRVVATAVDPSEIRGVAGSVAPPAAEQDLNTDLSFPPLVDGPARPPTTELPDTEAGTARTWFAEGTWWAVLPEPTTGVAHIWGLGGPDGPWIDTGTLVDDRPFAQVDVAWTGAGLVVASTGSRDYRSHALRLHRFSWSAETRRWVAAADHPIEVTTEGAPDVRMAVTPDGEAWLARTVDGAIVTTHTEGVTARIAPWVGLDVPGATDDVGGLDLVTEGDGVALVWRSLSADEITVARPQGEAWATQVLDVPGVAGAEPVDAAVDPSSGALLALARATSDPEFSGDQAASLLLVTLPSPGGTGLPRPPSVVARSLDGLRQPALVIDGPEVRVLAIVDPTRDEVRSQFEKGLVSPTVLVEKVARIADPVFAVGSGRRLVLGVAGADLSRPLVPAEPVGPSTGLVLVISGEEAGQWATLTEGVPVPPEVPQAVDPDQPTVLVDDTFESLPVGGPAPTRWRNATTGAPAGEIAQVPGLAGRSVRVGPTRAGEDPVDACRTVPELGGETVTVEAALRADGVGAADARLLTVKGPSGALASVRLTDEGLLGWLTAQGRVTAQPVALGTPLAVTITLDLASQTADLVVRTPDGVARAAADGLPWLATGSGIVDEVCVRPAPGAGTAIAVDSLKVTLR